MKDKAVNNRTILLDAEESEMLRKSLFFLSNDAISHAFSDISNKIVCGDALTALSKFPRSFADLIIVDPPYNLTKQFGNHRFVKTSFETYVAYLKSWFPAVVSCLKPSGSIYVCGDWQSTAAIQLVMSEYVTILNRITWQREKGRGARSNWKNGMEDIWFGVKDPKHYCFNVDAVKVKRQVMAPYKQDGRPKDWFSSEEGNFRLTYPSNFWDDITIPYWSMPENTVHPTQKSEKLMAKLILASSNEGDLVFDPFLGSGTTAVVAKKLNRQFCGIEINETYACLAQKRLQMADENKQIQGFSDGIFWERNTLKFQKKQTKKR
ncbi:MAG: DNA-methyltransferase [Microbacter sp.]